MSVLPKLICRFNAIPIKIPARFFCTHREVYSKIYKESHGLRTAKTILARIKWRNHSPYIEAYCIATVIGRDIDAAMEQNKDSRNRATEIQSLIVFFVFFLVIDCW